MTSSPIAPGRARMLALAIGGPVLLAALGISVIETWRVAQPDSPWFVTSASSSFADAIAAGNALETYELLRSGRDPNQPIEVRRPGSSLEQPIQVAPLAWALAHDREQVVLLLHSKGARLDPASRGAAVCFARERGRDIVARVLAADDTALGDVTCPPGADEPLLRLAPHDDRARR